MGDDTCFSPPPQCYVFEPTKEEFADPLAYIARIRHVAETSGICKVIPPKDWQPPFVVDVDNFRFTPRVQRLTELEATSRLKLNFLDKIAKFWHLKGSTLKIPIVERKSLDLYKLHRVVVEEGGFEKVGKERKWFSVVQKLGLPHVKSLSSVIRNHYERILVPYELFKRTGGVKSAVEEKSISAYNSDDALEELKPDRDYVPHEIVQRQSIPPPSSTGQRRSKRHCGDVLVNEEEVEEEEEKVVIEQGCKELKRLAFYGAGPKLPGYSPPKKKLKDEPASVDSAVAHIICKACDKGDQEDRLLLCDQCDSPFHTFCLRPPLIEIPKGEWRCPKCVASEVWKPKEAFGFEQARQEYSLQEFGEKADRFKRDYFGMPIHKIGTEVVEKEFWRVLNDIHEDVRVEYGADLHSAEVGSGFPTSSTPGLLSEDKEYVTCPWNLNNLASLDASVLSHIESDISGMKVPWVYVGMCFSTFCWHNEDHWSYSINYLHWGEPKTWYGVPGDAAEKFEDAMASKAPELFEAQPDLLHQLVTIMNPTVIQKSGVPIFRTDQKPGEFVITFPRAYHAGFNQGYNFAEAVNFCPADWLPIGRACIAHYALLNRFCVFSHDELICKMASDPDKIDIGLAAATFHDMLTMVDSEIQFRKEVADWGVSRAERVIFEIIPDDERQCCACKTTCFLSSITCKCKEEKSQKMRKEENEESGMACLSHATRLCANCAPGEHILKYRYTLDELPAMLENLKVRAESFDEWVVKVKEVLLKSKEPKPGLEELKSLLNEANDRNYPTTDVHVNLRKAVRQAENYSQLAQQLLATKVRTRRQESQATNVGRLSREELASFYKEMLSMQCTIKETGIIRSLLENVDTFCEKASELLKGGDFEECPLDKLQELTVKGDSLEVELPQLAQLRHKYERIVWLRKVQKLLTIGGKMKTATAPGEDEVAEFTLADIRGLLREGVNLAPHRNIESYAAELQQMLTDCEKHEDWAADALKAKPRCSIDDVEPRLVDAMRMPIRLHSVLLLEDALYKAKDWVSQMEAATSQQSHPYLDVLESLLNKSRHLQLSVEPHLGNLEAQILASRAWRDRATKIFMKKSTPPGITLLDVLSPREDFINSRGVHVNVKKEEVSVAEAFDAAAIKEMDCMKRLRKHNHVRRQRVSGNPLDEKYCICHRPFSLNMIQCVLCMDYFHLSCVPSSCISHPSSPGGGGVSKDKAGGGSPAHPSPSPSSPPNLTPPKFLCIWCQRSRRPRLESILSLLVSLQNVPVRLVEGEALQWLTDRAMLWQNKARQMLSSKEVTNALQRLSLISQQVTHRGVGGGTFSASLMIDAVDGEGMKIEHAYGMTPRKHARKSPIVPKVGVEGDSPVVGGESGGYCHYSQPLIHLGGDVMHKLEELLVEGDLLEVSLDETMHLWKILAATRPNLSALTMKLSDDGLHLGGGGGGGGDGGGKRRGRKPSILPDEAKRPRRALAPAGAVSMAVCEESEDSDKADEDEKCSADRCMCPEGDAVTWVQCDGGCDKWYHMVCVGLPEDHVLTDDDDYICSSCAAKPVKEEIL